MTEKSGSKDDQNPVVVVFDGACPLCSREIAHYRRRIGAQDVCWVDAAHDLDALAELGLTQVQALARFHVRDTDGRWQTGAHGFVLLWSQLRPYHLLAGVIRGLRLSGLLEWAYKVFLRWRNRRQCDADSCGASRD